MKLTSKYDLITGASRPGGEACQWISEVLAAEVVSALDAGSGAGVPDSEGTPTAGTIEPGMAVSLDANGNWELATSPDLSADPAKLIGFVHSGDDDFNGALVGAPVVLLGQARFLTEHYTGTSFPPGTPLSCSAGVFAAKPAAGVLQVVGFVGPKGLDSAAGVLDVLFCSGVAT